MAHALENAQRPTAHFVITEYAQLQGPADAINAGAVAVVEFESDQHLLRRGVDFLSGLAYGTRAAFDRLDSHVYRLIPAD